MLDVIICANFGVEKLNGLGNTRGQILEFPIEMAGHPYNRAGATAQPVMFNINSAEKLLYAQNTENSICCSRKNLADISYTD